MASDYRIGFRPFPWLPAGRDPFEVHIEMAVEAETLGFDGVFTVDACTSATLRCVKTWRS